MVRVLLIIFVSLTTGMKYQGKMTSYKKIVAPFAAAKFHRNLECMKYAGGKLTPGLKMYKAMWLRACMESEILCPGI